MENQILEAAGNNKIWAITVETGEHDGEAGGEERLRNWNWSSK